MVLTDREKDSKGEYIGFISLDLNSLMDQKMKDINDYVTNRERFKTKYKLHFQIKYLFSKVFLTKIQFKTELN